MSVLGDFCVSRSPLLNVAAIDNEHERLLERLGVGAAKLKEMYGLFDGETMWGAWLPGYRICRLREVVESMEFTADSWEWLEEERGEPSPMRSFVPFILTSRKSRIGPLLDCRSELFDHVIEYDYELGDVRVWSESIEQFFEAFFTLSLRHISPSYDPTEALNAALYEFSDSDVALLAKWPRIAYPVRILRTIDVGQV